MYVTKANFGRILPSRLRASPIGRHLLSVVLLTSTIISGVITLFQVYMDYSISRERVISEFDIVAQAYKESLANFIWNFDTKSVQLAVMGIGRASAIEFVKVSTDHFGDFQDGDMSLVDSPDALKVVVPLSTSTYDDRKRVGTLTLAASKGRLVTDAVQRAFTVFLMQFFKTMIVALVLLFLFDVLVTKHLRKIAGHLKEVRVEKTPPELKLSRRVRRDELQLLVTHVNLMQQRIGQSIARLHERERMLELSRRSRTMGQLATGVAHDFNNVLAAVSGHAEIIAHLVDPQAQGAAGIKSATEAIIAAVETGGSQARRLLFFSKPKLDRMERVDFVATLLHLVKVIKKIPYDPVHFEIKHPDHPLWILAAPGDVETVIINLVTNARAAMPRGGRLSMVIESRADQSLSLMVTDTGAGIPADVLPNIFEPFFSSREDDSGTGLGLSMVRAAVHNMQGTISVTSSVGVGTSFLVVIPLAPSTRSY